MSGVAIARLALDQYARPALDRRSPLRTAVSSAGRAGCGTMVRMMSLSETIACADPVLDVAQVVVMAKSLYRTGPAFRRKMQQLRPYTCPFDVLVSLVPENASVFGCRMWKRAFLGAGNALRKMQHRGRRGHFRNCDPDGDGDAARWT